MSNTEMLRQLHTQECHLLFSGRDVHHPLIDVHSVGTADVILHPLL